MTLLPSKRKENVRNWPGRAFSRRPSVTTKRKVFASEVCCATLANLKTSGPLDGEVAETARTGAFTVPAGVFDPAPARGPLEGRRTTRVSMLKNTNATKPIVRTSYRLGGAGRSAIDAAVGVTMLRPEDEAAVT